MAMTQRLLGSDDLNKVLEDAHEAERQSKLASEEENRRRNEENRKVEEMANRVLFPYLTRATRADYTNWLRGYFLSGGKPTHTYDYPFEHMEREFYLAVKSDFCVLPFYGATAIHIIVPKGIRWVPQLVSDKSYGHNTIYVVDGYQVLGRHNVPIFSDTAF